MAPQYFRIFRWHVLRHLRRHPLLGLLNILSVALGVAVYLATQIANHSANRAFAATVDLVAGKAELGITAPGGHLPEIALPKVVAVPGISAAIALSGYGMDEDVKRAKDAGFTAHLVKPVPFDQLRALLDQIASGVSSANSPAL